MPRFLEMKYYTVDIMVLNDGCYIISSKVYLSPTRGGCCIFPTLIVFKSSGTGNCTERSGNVTFLWLCTIQCVSELSVSISQKKYNSFCYAVHPLRCQEPFFKHRLRVGIKGVTQNVMPHRIWSPFWIFDFQQEMACDVWNAISLWNGWGFPSHAVKKKGGQKNVASRIGW